MRATDESNWRPGCFCNSVVFRAIGNSINRISQLPGAMLQVFAERLETGILFMPPPFSGKRKLVAQRFKSLLSGSPELRPLLSKVEALADLQRDFASVAPHYLAQCSQVLGLQFGTLSIAVANATAAAKLRQLAPELVVMLQHKGCAGISGIRVKVQVAFSYTPPKPPPRNLSNTAQGALQELSQSLSDSPLKHAIEKMVLQKG
jgi:hypothetical protein